MSEYVPAVDRNGCSPWLDQANEVHWLTDVKAALAHAEEAGWRRLYVREEPAPFEHSDMCEDRESGRPHTDKVTGGCWCLCPKCDSEGFCICPQCSRPASHAHRPVTS